MVAPGEGQPCGWCPTDPYLSKRNICPTRSAGFSFFSAPDPKVSRRRARVRAKDDPEAVFSYVRRQCGRVVQQRTATVEVTFEVETSTSLSGATFYVVRDPRGWGVWDWPI